MYGLTIDNPWEYKRIVSTLSKIKKKIIVRVVIDNIDNLDEYIVPIYEISKVANIMLCICDSYTMKQIPLEQYKKRVNDLRYLFNKQVYIWEIGNEVNGNWLGEDSVEKIRYAVDTLDENFRAITFHADAQESFIPWIKANLDIVKKCGYLLMSEYPQDTGYRMNWNKHIPYFDSLDIRYGYGECGTDIKKNKKKEFNHYYIEKDKELSIHSKYMGGYFWWYQRDIISNNILPAPLFSSFKAVVESTSSRSTVV